MYFFQRVYICTRDDIIIEEIFSDNIFIVAKIFSVIKFMFLTFKIAIQNVDYKYPYYITIVGIISAKSFIYCCAEEIQVKNY